MSATTEGLREDAFELGRVGAREGGCCCRMRRRPERPKPCSWSVIGDGLTGACGQQTKSRASTAGQIRVVWQVDDECRRRRRQETHLVIESWSAMPADEASKEARYRLRSAGSADRCRFPVLRFLGNERACMGRSCPLSSSLVVRSVPESRTGISHAALCGLASRVVTYGCLGGRHVSEAYL